MADKALPCPTRARLFVDYNPHTGKMTWKARSRAFFKTDHEWRRWNTRYAGTPALEQINSDGYRLGCIDKARVKAHRLVWAILHGSWPTAQIDHIDGDRANNSAANLRIASSAQNALNRKRHRNGTSRFKGVAYHAANKKWTAQINVSGQRHYLGTFATETDAARAYDAAAVRLHGTFSRLNGAEDEPSIPIPSGDDRQE